MRRATGLSLGLVLALLAACSGGGEPDGGPATSDSDGASPALIDASPRTLPTRTVEFSVELPEGTVAPVRVRIIGLHAFDTVREVLFEQIASTTWAATVEVEQGALIRYRYERTDQIDNASLIGRVEASHADLEMTWRLLAVTPDLARVFDTVAMWTDARVETEVGRIVGVVTDAQSGAPLYNVEVTAGGIHTATGIDGSFTVPGLAPGAHTLTLHRADGSVLARSIAVTVPASGDLTVEPVLEPAAPVRVTFRVATPADVPVGAEVSLFGAVEQLGGWSYSAPNQFEPLNQRTLGPATGEQMLTVTLHEGQYVAYRYNLGLAGVNDERATSQGSLRQFVVSAAAPERRDVVEAWRFPDQVFTTVHLRVPANFPAELPPLLDMGPQHEMTALSDGTYQATLVGWPGNRFEFSYLLGHLIAVEGVGGDRTAGLENGMRSVTSGETDSVVEHVVTDWAGFSGRELLAAGATTELLIRLSVGPEDEGVTRRLTGAAPLGGAELRPLAGNPSILEARVRLGAGEWAFSIEGCPNVSGANAAGEIALSVDLERPVLDLWSADCSGVPALASREVEYIAGIYTPDLFSPGWAQATESTFQSIEDTNGNAVALTAIFAYGQTLPVPTLERRSIFAGTVRTPIWTLRLQGEVATEHGLTTFMAPQFNFELSPGGSEGLMGTRPSEWWDAWLGLARELWLEHAVLANEVGSDLLLLPGPFFHAFGPEGDFPDRATLDAFNEQVTALIGEVRERYDGQLVIEGNSFQHSFIGDADLMGITGFGLQHPQLAASATLAEWDAAYEQQFRERVDPLHDRWGKPVIFYQLHVPSEATAEDPSGEYEQAKRVEALMRAIERRPWIAGSFSWSWEMRAAPELPSEGLRGRLGEIVQAKFFARLATGTPSLAAATP